MGVGGGFHDVTTLKKFQYDGAITADLQVLHAFNLLLHTYPNALFIYVLETKMTPY